MRENCKNTDFEEIGLPEDVALELKQAAEVSMGTEITSEDLDEILSVSERVRELTEYDSFLVPVHAKCSVYE